MTASPQQADPWAENLRKLRAAASRLSATASRQANVELWNALLFTCCDLRALFSDQPEFALPEADVRKVLSRLEDNIIRLVPGAKRMDRQEAKS